MALICIGGVCIPVTSLLPLLFLFFKPLYNLICGWLGIEIQKTATSPEQKACCDNSDKLIDINLKGEYLEDSALWSDIINSKTPTIVRFSAPWCKPCKEIEPTFKKLSEDYPSKFRFISIDIDQHDEIAASCRVLTIPRFQVEI